jgi:hypothetical protein
MSDKYEYIWIFDKKMKNWWGPNFGEPLSLSNFETIYVWFILFIVGWVVFYKFGVLKWKYTDTDIMMSFIGLFIGLCILFIFHWIDYLAPYILVNKDTHEVVLGRNENDLYDDKGFFDGIFNSIFPYQSGANKNKDPSLSDLYSSSQLVIIEDEIKLFDKSDTHSYAVNIKDLKKLEDSGKIKTMDLQKWLGKNYHAHDHAAGDNAGLSLQKIKKTIDQHLVFVSTLLLTLVFIIRLWNKKVFDKLFPWIIATLIFEVLLGTIWYIFQTYRDVVNNFYFIKKGQIVNSCFVIVILFLLIGSK